MAAWMAVTGHSRDRGPTSPSPGLYLDLGERLGALEHITSVWRYRFPQGKRATITSDELSEIFADFENGVSFDG